MLKIIATTTALAFALMASPTVYAKGKGSKATTTKTTKNWPSKAPKFSKK